MNRLIVPGERRPRRASSPATATRWPRPAAATPSSRTPAARSTTSTTLLDRLIEEIDHRRRRRQPHDRLHLRPGRQPPDARRLGRGRDRLHLRRQRPAPDRDPGGKVTRYTYDDNGNTLSKFTSAVDQALYEWDAQNRLVGATVTDATGTSDIAYQYDADGIRVASIVDGDETRYLIDTVQPYAQVLEEYTPGGVIKVSYVYGNDLISQDRRGRSRSTTSMGWAARRSDRSEGHVTDRYSTMPSGVPWDKLARRLTYSFTVASRSI